MAKVFYLTPFKEGDIGGGINESIALLPHDAWVCIRDADTLFLTSDVQRQINAIADSEPEYSVIGCRTNRLRSAVVTYDRDRLFECDSITTHIEAAKELEKSKWGIVSPLPPREVVAGMFMLFRVSLWHQFKFPNRSIYFDTEFCEVVKALGGKLGIAEGIYLFHLYRWGKADPFNDISHLR